jgi:hypothetical protein
MNKKAQITLFVILALVIVGFLILILMFGNKIIPSVTTKTPINDIKTCIESSAKKGIEIISKQGGEIEPDNYFLYKGEKIEYVCYTTETYKTCTMQKPLLKQDVEKELAKYITPAVKNCIDGVKTSLEGKGYDVTVTGPKVSVELVPDNAIINTNSDFIATKGDKTETYKNIKIEMSSGLYDEIMIASSISNFEARYGTAESMVYMIYYPSLRVNKTEVQGTRIYTITNKEKGDQFRFASRSLVFPTGLIG